MEKHSLRPRRQPRKSSLTNMIVASCILKSHHFHFGCSAFSIWTEVTQSRSKPFQRLHHQKRVRRRLSPCHAIPNEDEFAISSSRSPLSPSHRTSSGLILPSHPSKLIKSVMAPMVAASDYPFRKFLRDYYDVDLTYTQMIHSKNFIKDANFQQAHLDLWETGIKYPDLLPTQIDCLGPDIDKFYDNWQHEQSNQQSAPLMVQLAGDDANTIVQAALMIYEHTDGKLTGVDLNCGCPQNIAKKGNYGAFLMERDSTKVCQILKALRQQLPSEVVVSAKIRLPHDDCTLEDRITRLIETGIHFLTIHGRTIEENKTKVGPCHIDRIRNAVDIAHNIDPNFPIVANGGMENYNDVQHILQSTGAVAAMSSEALLETPNIFQKSSLEITTPQQRFQQQISFAKDYLDTCTRVGPPLPGVLGTFTGGSFNAVRGHLFKFLHRYINTEQVDIRDRLAANGSKSMKTLAEARYLVEELEERYTSTSLSDSEWASLTSSSPESSWYRRHRKSGRRVHQKVSRGTNNATEKTMTIEERKQEIKHRIAKLKTQRKDRKETFDVAKERVKNDQVAAVV